MLTCRLLRALYRKSSDLIVERISELKLLPGSRCEKNEGSLEQTHDTKEKERVVLVSTDKNPLLVPYEASPVGKFGVKSDGTTKMFYFQAPR